LTTSSETSTDRSPSTNRAAFQPWQFYILLSMLGATAAVVVARQTHPVALLALSAAVVCAGLVGIAFHKALAGFFGSGSRIPVAKTDRARAVLEREKALVLRSIKELEFDRNMGKVSEADFNEIGGRLRARALALMQDLERAAREVPTDKPVARKATGAGASDVCKGCGTRNDPDAKFCKQCGRKLEPGSR
jgi:ribosomal protein L40E